MKKILTVFNIILFIFNLSVFAYANETDISNGEESVEHFESKTFTVSDEDEDVSLNTQIIENTTEHTIGYDYYDIYSDEILEDGVTAGNNAQVDEYVDKSTHYETWKKKGNLQNIINDNIEYTVEGFAVGTNYCYSAEIISETSHRLFRKNLNDDTDAEIMYPSGSIDSLGHSNDMCLVTYKDNNNVTHYYIYVIVHFNTRANSYIVKLEYSGRVYEQKAKYNLNTKYSAISKVKYYTNSSGEPMVQFLLRGVDGYYTASVRRGQSGTYSLATTKRFTVSKPSAFVNYANQGIHYESNKIYIPIYGYNAGAGNSNPNQPKKNVILVYNVSNAVLSSTTIDNLIWSKYIVVQANDPTMTLFEIESIGFPVNNPNLNNNLLWFNTNNRGYVNGIDKKINGGIYYDTRTVIK